MSVALLIELWPVSIALAVVAAFGVWRLRTAQIARSRVLAMGFLLFIASPALLGLVGIQFRYTGGGPSTRQVAGELLLEAVLLSHVGAALACIVRAQGVRVAMAAVTAASVWVAAAVYVGAALSVSGGSF